MRSSTIPLLLAGTLVLFAAAWLVRQIPAPAPLQVDFAAPPPARIAPANPATGRSADPGLARLAEAVHREPAELLQLKADYFCDLARSLRERCESIPRNPEQMTFCLKANGYYTNTRHCGREP